MSPLLSWSQVTESAIRMPLSRSGVAVPEECDNESLKDEASVEDIAAAYHPECSAILKLGPEKPRPGCQERQDAMTFFTESYDRIRRVI